MLTLIVSEGVVKPEHLPDAVARSTRGSVRIKGARQMTGRDWRPAMAMMADRDNAARDVASQLGVPLSTLYAYVDAKGKPRARANELLSKRRAKRDTQFRPDDFASWFPQR
jgi:hypothetical protein